jgi:hypothetical protein
MLQMHNGSIPQCCYAASAYALLTYFRAKGRSKGLWMNVLCSFDEITTAFAAVSGGLRTIHTISRQWTYLRNDAASIKHVTGE